MLSESGIDTGQFKPHSTRHAATSAAFRKGISMDIICKAAGWSQTSTFARFYNRPSEDITPTHPFPRRQELQVHRSLKLNERQGELGEPMCSANGAAAGLCFKLGARNIASESSITIEEPENSIPNKSIVFLQTNINRTPLSDISNKQCPACSNNDLPSDVHKCILCSKNIHAISGCSISAGEEEGYGEKRICIDCSYDKRELAKLPPQACENWGGQVTSG
ncbi:hypothetical protein NQ315_015320 [Exocentrus adspersus]|uniref:SCAN domain-containing protein n=1 Tax=Exocentrus adspersus TaxID=1586481 RepID=A0AAV8V773_9CUCU|nr:hypothetical protein NQ315_015320 [Exocentrus adspersus]